MARIRKYWDVSNFLHDEDDYNYEYSDLIALANNISCAYGEYKYLLDEGIVSESRRMENLYNKVYGFLDDEGNRAWQIINEMKRKEPKESSVHKSLSFTEQVNDIRKSNRRGL